MEQKNSAWIIVSIILGISLFASAFVLTQGIKSIRSSGNEISLKGSAKEEIKSDYAVWSGSFSSNNVELQTAYQDLESTAQQVKDFLISKGLNIFKRKYHAYKCYHAKWYVFKLNRKLQIIPNCGNPL